MSKVRIIVKITDQPPIDTPASISHKTVVVESEELAKAIQQPKSRYAHGQVIGGEVIKEENHE